MIAEPVEVSGSEGIVSVGLREKNHRMVRLVFRDPLHRPAVRFVQNAVVHVQGSARQGKPALGLVEQVLGLVVLPRQEAVNAYRMPKR